MKEKASSYIKYYKNEKGPVIGSAEGKVIKKDGLVFKDIDGDGILKLYDDWREAPYERAKAFAEVLSADEKIGLLFVNSWKMGIFQADKTMVDDTGLLDEKPVMKGESIFSVESTYGTTHTIKAWGIRHLILRENPKPDELADWINQLNALAEECTHFIPVVVVSNSRNENGEMVFGMNDATGTFATWPGTLGIAAAVKGTGDLSIIDDFADCIRQEWDAVGMKKGYMYMADIMSDPRWQRSYGTFGEDPQLVCDILERLVPGIQGGHGGVTPQGVAMTVKHFPGGGARENGFDPHYAEGQWNVYQTEGSLQKYHLPAFQMAINKNVASIMPYYAKPAKAKSGIQKDVLGNEINMEPVGFAFNQFFIDELLRKQMGFKGYVNSDSGIIHRMAWGVEELSTAERVAKAVNAGVDLISGSFDVFSAREAYDCGLLTEDALNRAVTHTLKEMFELGLFDNPYRNPEEAVKTVQTTQHWKDAERVHHQSVVLLKNRGNTLPLTEDKLVEKKLYVECFEKDGKIAEKKTVQMRQMILEKMGISTIDDYHKADYAILFVNPSSGEYFNATKGYLELGICQDKEVSDVDEMGRPLETTHKETTLSGAERFADIYRSIHQRDGWVISNVNLTLAWLVGNVEQNTDVLLAGFDTYPSAILDIIFGRFAPVGKLPITLPRNDDVIRVDKNGICTSPNDVPGFDKDIYMSDEKKDENGKAYAYRDSEGNYYEYGFGLPLI